VNYAKGYFAELKENQEMKRRKNFHLEFKKKRRQRKKMYGSVYTSETLSSAFSHTGIRILETI
jgi:hypothetical protein